MKFDAHIPCDVLKPYVKSIAIQETAIENTYKVLPDTSLVMGFQYKGRLSYMEDGKEIQLSPFGVTGLRDRFRIFKNSSNIGSVLIFFHEGGAAAFFSQSLHELFGESISLDSFILHSELILLEEQLQEARTDQMRIQVVEKFLISKLVSFKPDPLILTALQLIHLSNGNIRIGELAEQLHISQSPLEKRFRKIVGTSPKKFASLVRLKQSITSFDRSKNMTDLVYEAGYYDQAHFIRQFKSFTGETPEKFFQHSK